MFFKKLSEYMGENIKFLINRTDEPYVFRLIKDKVFYMSETLMKYSEKVVFMHPHSHCRPKTSLVSTFYKSAPASGNSPKPENSRSI